MSDLHTEVPSSYPPPAEFAEQANAKAEMYREAEEDRLAFWGKQAERLSWDTPFTEVLDWSDAPFARWFDGGKISETVTELAAYGTAVRLGEQPS